MSRKIDALVAEHVMGWKLVNHSGGVDYWYEPDKVHLPPFSAGAKVAKLYCPSTEIHSAMEVLEKSELLDGWHDCLRKTSGKWTFSDIDCDGCWDDSRLHRSLPMLICIEALDLKGITVDD